MLASTTAAAIQAKKTTLEEVQRWMSRLVQVYEDWQANERIDYATNSSGVSLKMMFTDSHPEVLMAFEEIGEKLTAPQDFEIAARPLVLALDRVYEELYRWAEACRRTRDNNWDNDSRPDGRTVWSLLMRGFNQHHSPPVLSQPERISDLMILNPPPSFPQIADMYGWKDANGNDDVARVRRELNTPGSEFDPDEIMTAKMERYYSQFSDEWEARDTQPFKVSEVETNTQKKQAEAWQQPIAHEKFEDTARLPGMNVNQLAGMYGITIEEAKRKCEAAGIAYDLSAAVEMLRPEQRSDPNLAVPGNAQKLLDANFRQKTAGVQTFGRKNDMIGQAIAMFATYEDLTPGDVARLLTAQHPNATPDVIEGVYADYQRLTARPDQYEAQPAKPPASQPDPPKHPEDSRMFVSQGGDEFDEFDGPDDISDREALGSADLDAMPYGELRTMAKELGLSVPGNAKKDVYIDALKSLKN